MLGRQGFAVQLVGQEHVLCQGVLEGEAPLVLLGDAVLQQLAARFRTLARTADTVARFGGDEFVIVCEDVDDIDHAVDIAEQAWFLVTGELRELA